MFWKAIPKKEIHIWNDKLKNTNAAFYQYPYYVASEYNTLFAKSCFIQYSNDDKILAYAAVIEVGIPPFKIGVIDSGPVLLENNIDLHKLVEDLKLFARKKNYMHLQVRPAFGSALHKILSVDVSFEPKVFFPFHKKIECDANIYNKPEKELLAGFKLQGRRKIVLAARVPYNFFKIENEKALTDIRNLFKEVTDTKGYGYLPFKIYETIYREGKKYDLCDFYVAYLNDDLVNFIMVTKDAKSFYHYTSALRIKGYKANESPPAKLHLYVMQDCFDNEQKDYYNISYGGSDNLLRFKEYFNPVEVERPPYYTYVIKKKLLNFMSNFTPEATAKLRKLMKGN